MIEVINEEAMKKAKKVIFSLDNQVLLKLYISNRNRKEEIITRNLLTELSNFSDKLTLEVCDLSLDTQDVLKKKFKCFPLIEFNGLGKGTSRFLGIPIANEFDTLIAAIEDQSIKKSRLSTESIEFLKNVDENINIQIFVTPRCPKCPEIAKIAFRVSNENEKITTDVIEISRFPKLAKKSQVWSVPKIVINEGKCTYEGALTESEFICLLKNLH